jgi:hypothetical protein
MGNQFQFLIPKSLTVKSILFDALDSVVPPTENCLKNNEVWWVISETTISENPDSIIPTLSCRNHGIPQTEEWVSTFGHSFFAFVGNEEVSNQLARTLTIESCTFQHFFYDFTSFIGLANGHGNVVIKSSTFDKFSNWGSIIRDSREYAKIDLSTVIDFQYIYSSYFKSSKYSSYILENLYRVVPENPWEDSTWASIIIDSSTFSNFNYLKIESDASYFALGQNNEMRYRGVILNIKSFFGPIILSGNTFTRISFKYSSWEDIYRTQSDNTQFLWQENNAVQIKSLIFIEVIHRFTKLTMIIITQKHKWFNCL